MKWTHNNRTLSDRRKELRRNQTKAEEILWFELRNNKLGEKFKRQHSIGGYIADFYCQKYKLIIELDGGIHNQSESRKNDIVRDNFFTELGYKILRFQNSEVENNVDKVLGEINYIIK